MEILWGGISFAVLNHLSTIDLNQIPKKQIKAWIQYSIVLDSQISANHDKISPCLLFGIYGKSLVKPKSVKKWEQAKISNNLSLKTPFFKKLKRYARKFIKGE